MIADTNSLRPAKREGPLFISNTPLPCEILPLAVVFASAATFPAPVYTDNFDYGA